MGSGKRSSRVKWEGILFAMFLMLIPVTAIAEDQEDFHKELERIKERLKTLEENKAEIIDEHGHRLHPVRSLMGTRISGGLTSIAQGILNNEDRFGGNHTEVSISADLILEYGFGEASSVLFRLDWAPSDGLVDLPSIFVNPIGNPHGPNADIEGLTTPQLVEARYESRFLNDSVLLAFGQMDLTSYFDGNNYANSETDQFIAQQFVNNNTIDWGGDSNFLGPGVVLGAHPSESVGFYFGYFEGDGDYKDFFDEPFLIGQLSVQTRFGDKEGNYRVYGWGKLTDHCSDAADSSIFLDCSLIEGTPVKIQDNHTGFGLSLDQEISDVFGVWSRFGYQDPDVSQFDWLINGGLSLSGDIVGRSDDALGIAYGASIPSDAYERATNFNDVEHYGEIYYRWVPFSDGRRPEIQITPDIQIVANPGGDSSVDPVFIWGMRTQVNF